MSSNLDRRMTPVEVEALIAERDAAWRQLNDELRRVCHFYAQPVHCASCGAVFRRHPGNDTPLVWLAYQRAWVCWACWTRAHPTGKLINRIGEAWQCRMF